MEPERLPAREGHAPDRFVPGPRGTSWGLAMPLGRRVRWAAKGVGSRRRPGSPALAPPRTHTPPRLGGGAGRV